MSNYSQDVYFFYHLRPLIQMHVCAFQTRVSLFYIGFFCQLGELGKLEMLHEGILHKCIKQLLEKKKNVPVRDMAEDLECLCQIMRTVGRRLDTSKAKVHIFRIRCRTSYL